MFVTLVNQVYMLLDNIVCCHLGEPGGAPEGHPAGILDHPDPLHGQRLRVRAGADPLRPGLVPVVDQVLHLAGHQPGHQPVQELVRSLVERNKVPVGDSVKSQELPFCHQEHVVILRSTKSLKLASLPDQVLGIPS